MSVILFTIIIVIGAYFAGLLGSLPGLGGGFIIIPFLTLVLGVHIHYAIGASLVSVIATSSGAAAAYVRDRMTNVRVALLLEVGTTLGAISGVAIASRIDSRGLYVLFALLLGSSAIAMLRRREGAG